MKRLPFLFLALSVLVIADARPSSAHPHVWVTVKTALVYSTDGKFTAVRYQWTFDEMFSTFAAQGLDANGDGKLSREELQGLAQVNVTSLKDFNYFTRVRADEKEVRLSDPKEFWLEHANGALTLNFVLPLATPVNAKSVDLDIYDPTIFVDLKLAEQEPVALEGAAANCKVVLTGPAGNALAPPPNSNFGSQYGNKISVNCV